MKIILTESQIKKMVKGLHNQWKEVDGKLIRVYDFPTYKDTINFVNKVAEISTEQNHHPEMVIGFDTVKVIMFDHEEGRISDKCHKFTDAVDKMVDNEESLDEVSRSFAFTRKKRLFPKSAMMSNPDRFKEYDKEIKLGLNESKTNDFEKFAGTRMSGAKKISDTAKEKGGFSLLTYHHFRVKLPYYKKASEGKFNIEEGKKEYKELLKKLYQSTKGEMNIEQVEFQKLVGLIEVLGELIIKNK